MEPVYTKTYTAQENSKIFDGEFLKWERIDAKGSSTKRAYIDLPNTWVKSKAQHAIVEYSPDAGPKVVAVLETGVTLEDGSKKDMVKIGNGDWVGKDSFWHYDSNWSLEVFRDSSGKEYCWGFLGHRRILTVGTRKGPTIAQFRPINSNPFKAGGPFELTREAEELGAIALLTFMAGHSANDPNMGWKGFSLTKMMGFNGQGGLMGGGFAM